MPTNEGGETLKKALLPEYITEGIKGKIQKKKTFPDNISVFAKARAETKSDEEFLLLSKPLLEEWEENTRINSTLESLCECPIGMVHFFKFLQVEFNSENLQAYIDALNFSNLMEKENSTIIEIKVKNFDK